VAITYSVAITVAQSDHATINPATFHQRQPLPHASSTKQKAERYDSYGEKVAEAIKELKENPNSKLKHATAYHGLNNKTLFNRYYGHTPAARESHPESRKLIPEEERAVVKWVEKRDTLGFLCGVVGP